MLLLLILYIPVIMGCNEYSTYQECVRIRDCSWSNDGCLSVQKLKSFRTNSSPETETENEIETETEDGYGLVSGSPETTCTGLLETNCQFSPFCMWSAVGCVRVSGGDNEFERETETETEYGGMHTFDSTYESNHPIGYQPVPVPFQPVTPPEKFPCLEIQHKGECDMQPACVWDSRQICLPSKFIQPDTSAPADCAGAKSLLQCVKLNCEWDIGSQTCTPEPVLRQSQVRLKATRSCAVEGKVECHQYFGCQWDEGTQTCEQKTLHHEEDSAAKNPETITEDPEVIPVSGTADSDADSETESEPEQTEEPEVLEPDYTDQYSEPEPDYTDQYSEPEPVKSETVMYHSEMAGHSAPPTPALQSGLQSSYHCLTHSSKPICHRDTQCFWDRRQICLPLVLQTETTASAPTYQPPHMIPTEVESETENETESETQNGQASNSGFQPGPAGTGMGPINVCFYYADKSTCLLDVDCFWDQRTALCASLDMPNYLPQDCEGFFYEAPCQKDHRCVWKSGECEELNLDCEDMTSKKRCIGAKYNGVPCIWSDHEQECDEAPILLKTAHQTLRRKRPQRNLTYLWIVATIGSLLLIAIILRANKPAKELNEVLMDEIPSNPHVV